MALIVEDGSIVEDANSYHNRAALIAYAGLRGVLLADDDETDVLAIKAMDYLETFRDAFLGQEVEPGVQPLAWPRAGVRVGVVVISETTIPARIVQAQLALGVLASQGVNLLPTSGAGTIAEGGFVTEEKIGPITTKYSEAVQLSLGTMPTLPQVSAYIGPYLAGGAGPTTAFRK